MISAFFSNDARKDSSLLIAEVAQAHDGSLGTAHAFIDAVAAAGVDAVKFQTHIAEAESTPSEPWRIPFSRQETSRFEYWRRMEFTEEQWHGLKQHADEKKLIFLSSPFSVEAVELLSRVGVPFWKIASGEVGSFSLLEAVSKTALPVLLSSGLSSLDETDRAAAFLRSRNLPFAVMQCATSYPCPPERVGLNMLAAYKERYGVPVGISDHSGTVYPSLAAAALGATFFEVHVTFSKLMFGPDVSSSVTLEELKLLADGVRFIKCAAANPVDKDEQAAALGPLLAVFGKKAVTRSALQAGDVFTEDVVAFRKSAGGISEGDFAAYIGLKTSCPLASGEVIQLEHIEKN